MTRVKINVSGTHFEFDRTILKKKTYHTLTKMCSDAESTNAPLDFFVDRPADCFAAVLSYYQTDELHMPATVCPKAFRKELQYWGVEEAELDKCCLYRYYTFFDEFGTHEKFRQETNSDDLMDGTFIPIYKDNKVNRIRHKVWKVIDFKENTKSSKIYLVLVFLMVLLCITTLALSTVPALQRKLNKCELLEYLDHSENTYADRARNKLGNPDCSGNTHDETHDLEENDLSWDEYEDYFVNGNRTTGRKKVTLPEKKVKLYVFEVLEFLTTAFFTIDLILRLSTCPSVLRFFRSVINIFDILAVVGFYIHIIVVNVEKEYRYQVSWIRFINYLQIFRVMRLFRIVKNVRASRVLTFSLRQNGRDMTLLGLLVLIGVSTSASLIYFIEDRSTIESIPVAWYWAMITLTTVGYGDVTPKTGFGRLVATVLAMCGILLLAITLPMFVNNFLTLYQYSCLDDTINEHTKNKRKLKGVIKATALTHIKTTSTENSNKLNDENDFPGTIYTLSGDDTSLRK